MRYYFTEMRERHAFLERHCQQRVGNDQEKAQSEKKRIPTPKTEMGKNKLTIRFLYHEYIS